MLPRRKASRRRARTEARATLIGVAALLATIAACSRERPAPPAPPQLATVQRFVEHGVAAPDDARLTHGERVFVAGEARPVLTSAQSYVSGLLCDGASSVVR